VTGQVEFELKLTYEAKRNVNASFHLRVHDNISAKTPERMIFFTSYAASLKLNFDIEINCFFNQIINMIIQMKQS